MHDEPTSRHVLAINDEPAILKIYAELLTEEGFRVTGELMPFTDIGDVLAVAPDLIVLDLLVGHQDRGTAFLEMLKADPATRRLPVLICSADTERLSQLETRLRDLDCAVVTKPFDIDVFLEAVRSCLGDVTASPRTATGPAAA